MNVTGSTDPGFGIYVHWPFCLSKCPYCDFNSHVRQAPVDEARFLAAFRQELAHRAALVPGRSESTGVLEAAENPGMTKRGIDASSDSVVVGRRSDSVSGSVIV